MIGSGSCGRLHAWEKEVRSGCEVGLRNDSSGCDGMTRAVAASRAKSGHQRAVWGELRRGKRCGWPLVLLEDVDGRSYEVGGQLRRMICCSYTVADVVGKLLYKLHCPSNGGRKPSNTLFEVEPSMSPV